MKTHRANAPLGASLVVVSSLFYASYGVWTTLMGGFFGGYTASALRSALVLLILLLPALAYRQLTTVNWRDNWRYLVALLCTAIPIWGPLYFAILQAGVGVSLAINYACLAMGMLLFGRLLAGERFTKDKMISLCLGLIGLVLIFSPSVSAMGWLALGAAAVSGFSIAAHMVVAKKLPYNTTQTTVFVWASSVIASIPMMFIFGEPVPAIGLDVEWLYLVLFALTSVAASWTYIKGLKLIDAGAAGIIGLLEIVFGVVFGILLFAEQPGPIVLLGVGVVIAAAAVPYAKNYRAKRKVVAG